MRVDINGNGNERGPRGWWSYYLSLQSCTLKTVLEWYFVAHFHYVTTSVNPPVVPTLPRTNCKTLSQIISPFESWVGFKPCKTQGLTVVIWGCYHLLFTNFSASLTDTHEICVRCCIEKGRTDVQPLQPLSHYSETKKNSKNWKLLHNSLGSQTRHDLIWGHWSFFFIQFKMNVYIFSCRNVNVWLWIAAQTPMGTLCNIWHMYWVIILKSWRFWILKPIWCKGIQIRGCGSLFLDITIISLPWSRTSLKSF